MSGSNKHMLVPQLRFPEFRNAEKWTIYNLGQLSKIITKRVGDDNCIPYTITSGVGLISQQEKLGRTIAGNSLKNYILLQRNDFAYNKSATKAYPQGYIACYFGYEPAAVPNSIFTCFRPDKNLVIPAFLDNLFTANLHGKWLKNRVAVGARANGALQVNNDDLMKVPVPLPTGSQSLSEQKKISDCLSSLDDLLTVETQKLNTLKKYKKGLMQQLFPNEGENMPRLRFTGFRNAGAWEVKALSHYVKSLDAGVSVNSGDRPACGDEIGILKTSCVSSGSFDNIENKVVTAAEEIARVKEPVRADTIIISRMNTIALVGANAYVENDIPTLFLPDRLWAAKATGNGSMRFLSYVLGSERGRATLSSLASGSSGSMKNIGKSEVLAIRIAAPLIKEQQRIAEILSSLDNLISAQIQKIQVLKNHRKGLMQQLFPVLDEVSA